jgi:hypothetical protein
MLGQFKVEKPMLRIECLYVLKAITHVTKNNARQGDPKDSQRTNIASKKLLCSIFHLSVGSPNNCDPGNPIINVFVTQFPRPMATMIFSATTGVFGPH